jgi:hypothetical protein
VRLGLSTPGDYVRARALMPRNPGVTGMDIEGREKWEPGVQGSPQNHMGVSVKTT